MIEFGDSLQKIVRSTFQLKQVVKGDLQFGDIVFIVTRNSLYSVFVLDDNSYLVSGGWFDRKGLSPKKIAISGCIWGGTIIKVDILAACGLRLEFGNHVVTTPIQEVFILRCNSSN